MYYNVLPNKLTHSLTHNKVEVISSRLWKKTLVIIKVLDLFYSFVSSFAEKVERGKMEMRER